MIERLATITHTEYCAKVTAEWRSLHDQFSKRWPNHCETCHGAGGYVYYFDPSPGGISLGSGYMEDFEPCPDCIEQGKCPRCGEEGDWTMEEASCPACGWDSEAADRHSRYLRFNQKVDADHLHAVPPEPECWCVEDW